MYPPTPDLTLWGCSLLSVPCMVPSTRHGLTGSYPEMSLYSGDIPSHPTSSFLCLYLHTGSGVLIRRQMSPPHACLQTPDLQFFLLPSSYLGHHHTGSRVPIQRHSSLTLDSSCLPVSAWVKAARPKAHGPPCLLTHCPTLPSQNSARPTTFLTSPKWRHWVPSLAEDTRDSWDCFLAPGLSQFSLR